MHRLVLPLALLAAPALADAPPGRLIAALSGDWNGDSLLDAVLLVQGAEDTADLQMYRGGATGLEPLFTVSGAAYSGPFGGQAAALRPLTDTTFAIETEQTGFGRTPWTASVTVAYHDNAFWLAAYGYSFYDRLDLGHYGRCDVDLVTGQYTISLGPTDGSTMGDAPEGVPDRQQTGTTDHEPFALVDLTDGAMPQVCADLFR